MANNEELSQDVKVEEAQPVSAETVTTEASKPANTNVQNTEKAKKDNKAKDNHKKSKNKKPNKIAKSLKETSSELKKVTWPKFSKVVKQTGVVLLVTALFLLVVFGIDRLCSWLVGFIV